MSENFLRRGHRRNRQSFPLASGKVKLGQHQHTKKKVAWQCSKQTQGSKEINFLYKSKYLTMKSAQSNSWSSDLRQKQ
eukprot:scaffold230315_cov14-Tisochrysis_lutea.AAC.1